MKTREATPREIIDKLSMEIEWGWKVRFKHLPFEYRTKRGIQRRQYSSSKVYVIGNRPLVRYKGAFIEIVAKYCELTSGRSFLGELRIKE